MQEVEAQVATLKQEAEGLATVIAGLQEQIAVLNASLQEREAAQGTATPASLVICAIPSLDSRPLPTLVYLACPWDAEELQACATAAAEKISYLEETAEATQMTHEQELAALKAQLETATVRD